MLAVMQRELKSYFTGVTAYIYAAVTLIICGYLVKYICFDNLSASFEYVPAYASIAFVPLIPLLSMRTLAEERHSRTDQLLFSLPITVTDIVVGKYLAMVIVIGFTTTIMAVYPLLLGIYGNLSLPLAYSSLFGYFLLGASLAAIGLFISGLTESQIFAAVVSLLVMAVLYFSESLTGLIPASAYASLVALCVMMLVIGAVMYVFTRNAVFSMGVGAAGIIAVMVLYFVNSSLFIGLFPSFIGQIAPFERYYSFVSGIFDLKAILYYLSSSAVFLFFTVQTLERRRWS